jgi:hypothetical protein
MRKMTRETKMVIRRRRKREIKERIKQAEKVRWKKKLEKELEGMGRSYQKMKCFVIQKFGALPDDAPKTVVGLKDWLMEEEGK